MESRNEKNIYTYFNYNRNLIECVYKITPMQIKENFKKKWGSYLTGTIHSQLSQAEVEQFYQYAAWFESKLVIAQKMYTDGYSLKEISGFLVSGKVNEKNKKLVKETTKKTEVKRVLPTRIYPELSDVLKQYHIAMDDLDPIIETLSKEQRISFIYYYGINHKKYSISKIASILDQNEIVPDCTENDVKKYIESVYKIIESQKRKKEKRIIHTKQETIISVKIYKDKEEILQQFCCTEDELEQLITNWSEEQEKCFRYVNGIGRPKMCIREAANALSCDEVKVREYLSLANENLEKHFKNNRMTLNQNKQDQTQNKETTVEVCKKKVSMSDKSKKYAKTSLYEGFAEEEYKYVTKVIESWKIKKPNYYDLIIRVYGKTYDQLNLEVYHALTEEESKIMHNIKNGLRQHVEKLKKQASTSNKSRLDFQTSLYEGFAKEEYKYVTKVIESWKIKKPNYYDLIIKVYGKTYDQLNLEVYHALTKEEKNTLYSIRRGLKERVETCKRKATTPSISKTYIKTSLYEGFAEEEYKYVTKVITYWKIKNQIYYDLIIKVYGKTYDQLNLEVYHALTEEESKIMHNIKNGLRQHVEKLKKQASTSNKSRLDFQTSLYEGFAEEEYKYVTKVIESWKIKKPNYYDLIIKVYGKTYDQFNLKAYHALTKEEKNTMSIIKCGLKERVETCKKNVTMPDKSRLYFQTSLYEGFIKEDYKYVTKVIESWKFENPKYYDLIVRVFGISYNQLNVNIYTQLTQEEQNILHGIKRNLKERVETCKRRAITPDKSRLDFQTSLYEGFVKEDYKYVTKVIEDWKIKKPNYYNLIVRVFGKTYDQFNIESYHELTKEERNIMYSIKRGLKERVETCKRRVITPDKSILHKLKLSLYEGFIEEDYKYVTEVIEHWKQNNKSYYNLIVKVYGMAYNQLNLEVYNELTKEERKIMCNIKDILKQQVKNRKKRTLKNSEIKIEITVESNKEKPFQNNRMTINPSGQEQTQNKETTVETHMKKGVTSDKYQSHFKMSLYGEYKKEDKKYVIEVLAYWKLTNQEYDDLLVKVYGKKYSQFNLEAYNKLTSEEREKLHTIETDLKIAVEDKKRKALKNSEIKIETTVGSNKGTLDTRNILPKTTINPNIQSKKREILIQDIFPNEIMEIGKYVYIQMQNPNNQKDAIAAWDRLENLKNKPITDENALQSMIDLIQKFQNSPLQMTSIDEDTIATRIKKFHL